MRMIVRRSGLLLLVAGFTTALGCGGGEPKGPKVEAGKGELKPLPAPGAPGGPKQRKQPGGGVN